MFDNKLFGMNNRNDLILVLVSFKGGIGLNVAQMIVELIRDKRKIVDRITKNNIDTFLQLLRTNKVYTVMFYTNFSSRHV